MSVQTCGADPRRVRAEWRDGGGRTHLVGVTELGRMLGNDPNLALLVLYGLGRWEAGRSGGGMDPQRKGWVRVEEGGGETSSRRSSSSSSSSSSTSGETTPPAKTPKPKLPPKAPKKKPCHFQSSEEDPPPFADSVGPNFSHHKARVQAVGWFPLGTRKKGSRPFAAPTAPPTEMGPV